MLFIRTGPGIEPSKFVHDLLVDMAAKQIKKTRYLSRFLPVQQTCMANIPEMERVAKLVIHPQFNEPNEDGTVTKKKASLPHDERTHFSNPFLTFLYSLV